MPRIRYLKPEFFSDEDLGALPYQTRLAFAGLWCYADKAGRLEDRPKFLNISIFPYDAVDMEKELKRLAGPKPFIHRYEVDGKRFIQIINWDKHQRPHHTEKESIFPPPPDPPPAPPLNTNTKGMEKGMEKQLNPSAELSNGDLTVKEPLSETSSPPHTHPANGKSEFGEFKNVFLTEEEYQKLIRDYSEEKTKDMIERLSLAVESKGPKMARKYKSHYATIKNWERNGWMEGKKGGMIL